jgi:hypothetical protein
MRVIQQLRIDVLKLLLEYDKGPTLEKVTEKAERYMNWIMTGDLNMKVDENELYPKVR